MTPSATYESLISLKDRRLFEQALNMEGGYLLDFTDRTFAEFFFENVGIDPDHDKAYFEGRGTSKAKRFRAFVENAPFDLVAMVLRNLWEYRSHVLEPGEAVDEQKIQETYFQIVERLEGRSDKIDTTAIDAFEPSVTLEELVESIKRDIDAAKPQSAMDRLHTYCMKRFGSLVYVHTGESCGKNDALHARVGRYVKALKQKQSIHPISERIISTASHILEGLNPIRNNFSLAHDNPDLMQMEEARFVFESVTAILRYFKSIDGQAFEDQGSPTSLTVE